MGRPSKLEWLSLAALLLGLLFVGIGFFGSCGDSTVGSCTLQVGLLSTGVAFFVVATVGFAVNMYLKCRKTEPQPLMPEYNAYRQLQQ